MTTPQPLTLPDMYAMYAALAFRVQALGNIIQNEPPAEGLEAGVARVWASDVRCTVQDLTDLLELTRLYVLSKVPSEPK